MGKKDKKSKTAEHKARLAAKQSKKASQKEKKGKAREVDDSDADDVDLESVLEQYAEQVDLARRDGSQPLIPIASTVLESHRGTMRATISSLISNLDCVTFELQRTISFWRGVFQWGACYILQ